MRLANRLHRFLAGSDGPGRRALPAGEFLHPVPLVAALLLAVNDHVLKGAGILPGWLTGKLSDFVGLLFFPLLLTACGDCLALAAARLAPGRALGSLDFSLRRWKLLAAIGFTALLFSALKLSPAAAAAGAKAFSALGFHAAIVADPTDLFALPALAGALLLGRREIARVPLGRLEALERAAARDARAAENAAIQTGLADAVACGAEPGAVDRLASAFSAYLRQRSPERTRAAKAALSRLREA